MATITLDTLGAAPYAYRVFLTDDPKRDLLVQTDYDYPGIASTFGWSVRDSRAASGWDFCHHDGTDGTIACSSCGRTVSGFINSAADWLDSHDGATVDDPGYFGTD